MNQAEFAEEQIRQAQASGVPYSQDAADGLRALCESDDLKLFWIDNTAGKRAYYLARTPRFARHWALRTGHIQALENGQCMVPNEGFFRNNPGFGSAVQRAIKDLKPGLIERRGNHAVMGDKVYPPMSVVK